MGTIDENTIESLSFIANLSQHILASSRSNNSENELSSYFPSFNFVIRDFSLDLIDKNQNNVKLLITLF